MLDLTQVLKALGEERPIFHSEADFQHALAWEIQKAQPGASIRLELPVQVDASHRIHLDLLVASDQERYAIELKYRTAAMEVDEHGERFSLAAHSAQDTGRYDFLKDIARLEHYVASIPNSMGFAIFLSNDSLYWKEPRQGTTSEQFSIHDKREIPSKQRFCRASHAGPGSTMGRESPLSFGSSYVCSWQEYSKVGGRQLKYLSLTVAPPLNTTQ
jgi:hypothetical protein